MSRLTGFDALGLMEAYSAVYASQEEVELTEEQILEIQEDFENWVNSLVEEGYDLSEFTWEDMYEEYLNEMGQRPTTGQARAPISNAPYQSRFARPMNAGTPQQTGRGTLVSRPQIGSLPPSARQVTQYPQGVRTGVGGGNAGASIQTPTRPVTAPARTATTPRSSVAPTAPVRPSAPVPTSARPTTTAPATAQSPTLGYQLAQRGINIGSNILKPRTSAVDDIRAMRQRSQQRIMAQGGTPATPLVQSFDPFDVVMGYLIDEGYAENESAAAVIMANMSEEWREEILEARQEEGLPDKKKRRIRRLRLPYDGGKGKRAETVRQEWHKDQRGKRGESPLASNPRYENEPGRRIRGQGYVRYSDDDN